MNMRIPFVDLADLHRPLLAELQARFTEAVATSAFIGGPAVEQFEAAFAEYCGVAHAVGVSNGTDALRLALLAAGAGAGDVVLTAANTFFATAEAVLTIGARLALADVDQETLLMTPETVTAALRRLDAPPKACIPVHLYGQCADVEGIRAVLPPGTIVIEDACQAHGATRRGMRAGALGDAAAFSFYPGKNLGALGDGGAVTTQDAALAEQLRMLRDHGQRQRGRHELIGYNHRLDAIQAAFLHCKLPHLDEWNARRSRLAARYRQQLADSPAIGLPRVDADVRHCWHLFVVLCEERDALAAALQQRGIGTGIHYPFPVHRQPAVRDAPLAGGGWPIAEWAAPRLLSLPMHPGLSEEDVGDVAATIREIVAEHPPLSPPTGSR